MDSLKRRRQKLFMQALSQGMGAGVFGSDFRCLVMGGTIKSEDPIKGDWERIGGDFKSAIVKEEARHHRARTRAQ